MANKVPDFTPAWLSFPSSNDGNANVNNKNVWSRGNSPMSATITTSSAGKQMNGLKPLELGKINDIGTNNHLPKKVVKNANDNEDDSNFLGSKLYTSYRGSANGKKEPYNITSANTVGFDTTEDFPELSVTNMKDPPKEYSNFLSQSTSSSVWSTTSNLSKSVKPAAKAVIDPSELSQPTSTAITRTSSSPSIGISYKDVAASTVVVSGKYVRRSRIMKLETSNKQHAEKNFKYANNKITEPKLQNIQKSRPTLNKSGFFEAVRSESSILPRNKIQINKKIETGHEDYQNRVYDESYNGDDLTGKGYINNSLSKIMRKIEINNHDGQNTLENLPTKNDRTVEPAQEISISLEGEQRLLRAMGWQDESDDDSFVPITEDEKKEFLSRQMQHQLSGLSNMSLLKNQNPSQSRSNTISCSSDSSISSSESSDNEDF